MPDKTPLYDRHVALGAKIVDFHGWLLPVQYAGILAEHAQCRSAASLFDTSHMGYFLIGGANCDAALANICTQDTMDMPVGRCQYGFLLNDRGGILDDTIVMRLADKEFLLVVNAGPMKGDFAHVGSRLGGPGQSPGATTIENLSGQWGKLDLQGPASFSVLADAGTDLLSCAGTGTKACATKSPADLAGLRYFHARRGRCLGHDCIISRTGYTGELGYEIFAPAGATVAIFDALLADDRVRPAGLGARDLLRLEMSYPLYGEDITEQTNPLEADLGQFISLDRRFAGSAALAEAASVGLTRKLVAFASASRQRAMAGQAIRCGPAKVGAVTSGGFSPSLGVSIGLGYVSIDHAAAGTQLTVATQRGDLPIVVADKPLYKQGSCRMKLPAAAQAGLNKETT